MNYKKIIAFLLVIASFTVHAEGLQPFFLASSKNGDHINEMTSQVVKTLKRAKYKILKVYKPYKGSKIVVFTNRKILKAAAETPRGGYGAPQRVGITLRENKTWVTYTNPTYFAHAYRLKNKLEKERDKLKEVLGFEKAFGAGEEGLSEERLAEYNYTWGMESFVEPIEIASYDTYTQALRAIRKGFKRNDSGVVKLYELKIPGRKATVFGVALKSSISGVENMDDEWIMSFIDSRIPPSTPHLPYEILVSNKDVESLNSRFRIAISFPTLKMFGKNSFAQIMWSPDAIEDSYKKLLGVTESEDDF